MMVNRNRAPVWQMEDEWPERLRFVEIADLVQRHDCG